MSIKALKEAFKNKKKEVQPLFALVAGCSGAGKSYIIGTLGVPTLYLYLSSEAHGPASASSTNENIVPVCLDMMEEFDENIPGLIGMEPGSRLTASQTMIKLMHYANLSIKSEGFGAIALDSLTDIEQVIKATPEFKQACTGSNGKYNKFNESDELAKSIRNLVINFIHHTNAGVHVIVTCAGTVVSVDENAAASTIQLKLSTYGVVDTIPRLFADVLLVSRARFDDETKHVISFDGNFQKVSKDTNGKPTKMLNFSPRITGLSTEELPEYTKADLKEIIKLKNKEGK